MVGILSNQNEIEGLRKMADLKFTLYPQDIKEIIEAFIEDVYPKQMDETINIVVEKDNEIIELSSLKIFCNIFR